MSLPEHSPLDDIGLAQEEQPDISLPRPGIQNDPFVCEIKEEPEDFDVIPGDNNDEQAEALPSSNSLSNVGADYEELDIKKEVVDDFDSIQPGEPIADIFYPCLGTSRTVGDVGLGIDDIKQEIMGLDDFGSEEKTARPPKRRKKKNSICFYPTKGQSDYYKKKKRLQQQYKQELQNGVAEEQNFFDAEYAYEPSTSDVYSAVHEPSTSPDCKHEIKEEKATTNSAKRRKCDSAKRGDKRGFYTPKSSLLTLASIPHDFAPDRRHIRHAMLFLHLSGMKAPDIQRQLAQVYPSQAPDVATVRRWCGKFEKHDYSIEDDARSGRPEKLDVDQLRAQVESDPTLSTRTLSRSLGVSRSTVTRGLALIGRTWKDGYWVPDEAELDRESTDAEADPELTTGDLSTLGAPKDLADILGATQDPAKTIGVSQDPADTLGVPQHLADILGVSQDLAEILGAPQDPAETIGMAQDQADTLGEPQDLADILGA
ncbi:hypothetical protein PMAYCL1PPCAC_04713, partial [Pristionchus mayeri]